MKGDKPKSKAEQAIQQAPDPKAPFEERVRLIAPDDYVAIVPVGDDGEPLAESERRSCGTARLRAAGVDVKGDEAARAILTERCYELPPGADVKLRVTPHKGRRAHRPKGELVLASSRGRLSATRIDLGGQKGEIEIGYRAPDETIKVSIRAFVEGFHRGKVHLHLDPD